MPHIFISYSQKDNEYVYKLADKLKDKGFDVWIDNDRLKVSDKWWETIVHAIWNCAGFIVVMTPQSHESEWVQSEVYLARNWSKQIFPILLDGKINDPEFPNWAMFGPIQIQLVKSLELPPDSFYERLSYCVAPIKSRGQDVTTLAIKSSTEHEVIQAITQPPPKEEFRTNSTTKQYKQKQRNVRSRLALMTIVALVFVLVTFASVVSMPLLFGPFDGTQVASVLTLSPSPEIVNSPQPTSSSVNTNTPTTTSTPTTTDTLEVAQIVNTLDTRATLSQATLHTNNTAAAQFISQSVNTISARNATATAALWTATATANITASIEAYRTQQIEVATTQYFAYLTVTATLWTLTPTSTLTSTPTPTSTLVVSNSTWTPVENDFAGVTMVLVPIGCFTMGNENGDSREAPTTRICFNQPFWIDKYEVTNAQFEQFHGVAGFNSSFSGNNKPRENVTWIDAQNFCTLRNMRLPTEAEWEYAARGPDSLIYPWGNTFNPNNIVYFGNSGNHTMDVGSYPQSTSWVGALDMIGNVWEWTSTIYRPYPYPTDENGFVINDGRETPVGDHPRVRRGGAWNTNDLDLLRATYRGDNGPYNRLPDGGFRCVGS